MGKPLPNAPPPPRADSHVRVRPPARRSYSTLPPAPFQTESEVAELAWWLDAHVALVSNLLVAQQIVEGEPGEHGAALQELGSGLRRLRDALYECYCDAVDPRVLPMVGSKGSPLRRLIAASYQLAESLLGSMVSTVTQGDASELRKTASQASATWGRTADETLAPIRGLLEQIPMAEAVDPLRHARANFDAIVTSAGQVRAALRQRFPNALL